MTPWAALQREFVNSPGVIAFGGALLHFVWQGALAALALWVALRATRSSAPATRYALTCACLLVMFLAVPVTWWIEYSEPPTVTQPGGNVPVFQIRNSATQSMSSGLPFPFGRAPVLAWLVAAWCAGVAVRGTWAVGGWWVARRDVLSATGLPSTDLTRVATDLARRLGVSGRFRLLTTVRGTVPSVFGWLKPILIVPVAALAGLSSWQLEAVLAHELAHIARRDALVNALQTAVECLLFYHPAVWWVSRRMREEREHCCDDLAVQICGDRLEYSKALLALEETRSAWVLAASGGHLRGRIARLLGSNDSLGGSVMMPLATVIVLTAFLGGSLLAGGQTEKKPGPKPSAGSSSAIGADAAHGPHAGVASKTGASGGVPGGVRGGVSTGVPGGTSTGVSGGVPGGIYGGVVGGVPGGVGGGVSMGIPGQMSSGVSGGVPGGIYGGVVGGVPGGIGAGVSTGGASGVGRGIGEGGGSGLRADTGGPGQGTNPEAGKTTGTEERQRDREQVLRELQEVTDRLKRDTALLEQLKAELERAGAEQLATTQREQAQAELATQQFLAQEKERERRVRYVEERFKEDGGRASDRGAVYLELGAPTEVETSGDVQIWRYQDIPGIGRNVEFRFEGHPMKKVSGPDVKIGVGPR